MIDPGLVGSMDFYPSHPQGHEPNTARAEDAQGTPTQSHISPSKLAYEANNTTEGFVPTSLRLLPDHYDGEMEREKEKERARDREKHTERVGDIESARATERNRDRERERTRFEQVNNAKEG